MQQQAGSSVEATASAQAQQMADGCLGIRVGRLHRLVSRRFDAELRPLGLTLPQLEVLAALTLADRPARPSEVAGWLGLERSTISRNLDVLAQRGFVRVAETSAAGRTTRVQVSTAGLQALADAETAWRRAQTSVDDALGTGAVGTLDGWLGSLSG